MKPLALDTDLFDQLSERSGNDLISIFIPTHQRGRDVVQDPIRLKNQLSEVGDFLEEVGWKPRQRSDRLARAVALLEDNEFWEHQLAGLALYIDDEGEVVAVSTPVGLEAESHVGQVFHMRHLVPGLGLARVPILLLTKNAVRLFLGSRLTLEELEEDLPESFDDVNWFVDRETQRQQHPDRAGTARNRHGHDPSSRTDEDRSRFLRAVADAIPNTLQQGPMVVLGDDDLVERFGQVSDFETVSPDNSGVGNPEDDSLLLDLASPAISQIESVRETEALKQAMDRLGVGRATTSVADALPGAVAGRIEDVVMERSAEPIWGRLDATDMSVEIHDEWRHGDVDLLDRLVVESRKTGASVTTVTESIEGDSFVASSRY